MRLNSFYDGKELTIMWLIGYKSLRNWKIAKKTPAAFLNTFLQSLNKKTVSTIKKTSLKPHESHGPSGYMLLTGIDGVNDLVDQENLENIT